MSEVAAPPAHRAPTVPVASAQELMPYVVFAGTLLMMVIFFVGAAEGATASFAGGAVHEWVHDARHLLGFPCH